jgi:hypothetical protein
MATRSSVARGDQALVAPIAAPVALKVPKAPKTDANKVRKRDTDEYVPVQLKKQRPKKNVAAVVAKPNPFEIPTRPAPPKALTDEDVMKVFMDPKKLEQIKNAPQPAPPKPQASLLGFKFDPNFTMSSLFNGLKGLNPFARKEQRGGEGPAYDAITDRMLDISIFNNRLLLPELLGNISGICEFNYPKHDSKDYKEDEDFLDDPDLVVDRDPTPYRIDISSAVVKFNEADLSTVRVHIMYMPPPGVDPVMDACVLSPKNPRERYGYQTDSEGYVLFNAYMYILYIFMMSTNFAYINLPSSRSSSRKDRSPQNVARQVESPLQLKKPQSASNNSPGDVLKGIGSMGSLSPDGPNRVVHGVQGGSRKTKFFNIQKIHTFLKESHIHKV